MTDQTLPRDAFSEALRAFEGNPGATRSDSTIHIPDFYGRNVTWVITTFRADGQDTTLLQRIGVDGSALREVLPPKVTDALSRHRSSAASSNRRRGARQAVATKIAKGQQLGNLEALKAARGKPRTRRTRRRRGTK